MLELILEALYTKTDTLILLPAGAAKTTWGDTIFLSWLISMFKDVRVGLFSQTSTFSENFSRAIMHTLESNERLHELFGDIANGGKWTYAEWLRKDSSSAGSNNLTLFAGGTGGQVASKRFDLILCHQRGTQVLIDGRWMAVEDHPTATSAHRDGLAVSVWGLPFPEVVTPEHRYWTMDVHDESGRERWREAESLSRTDAIGWPIDTRVDSVRPIPKKVNHLVSSGKSGVRNDWQTEDTAAPEFDDPDWWWALGLWWGDGHRGRRQVGWTLSNDEVSAKLERTLARHGYPAYRSEREGCWQIVTSSTHWAAWLGSWKSGNSRKTPPPWVERIDPRLQAALLRGYIDADGFVDTKQHEIRVTSIHLDGLLSARRMLARLRIPSSIRKGAGPGIATFGGRESPSAQKYDLRFHDRYGPVLGFPERPATRFSQGRNRTFIENGVLWSKVRGIEEVEGREFIPIQTEDHTYLTAFGRSHNCDDILGAENTETVDQREKTKVWFDQSLYPRLVSNGVCIVFGTRWGADDLYQTLMDPPEEGGYGFRTIVRRALDIPNENDPSTWTSYWPEIWPVSELIKRRNRNKAMFDCTYQNDVGGLLSGDLWQKRWYQYYGTPHGDPDAELPVKVRTKRMGVDLASSIRERADFTARVTSAEDEEGNFYVMRTKKDKIAAGHPEFIVAGYEETPGIGLVKIENNQFQSTVVAQIAIDYPQMPISSYRADTDKVTRARALIEKYQQHKVWHHTSLKDGDLEREQLGFRASGGTHDDLVDAEGYSFDMGGGSFFFGKVKMRY